jgi:hypothetical protein
LEAIGPNRTFIHPVSTDKSDEFTIDLAPISTRSSVGFTYKGHSDDSNVLGQGPLIIKPAWQQLSDKLQLLVEYSVNPASGLETINFQNFVIVAHYEGSRASAVQTKPSGTHLKEQKLVYWRLGDITLSAKPNKVICRFAGFEGAVPIPGRIEARWEIQSLVAGTYAFGSGISLSRLEISKGKEKEVVVKEDDPFADEGVSGTLPAGQSWVDVQVARKFVSGKYEAVNAF